MPTTNGTNDKRRRNLIWIGLLAVALMSAGVASARDYDSDRSRVSRHDTRHGYPDAVRGAYRADVRIDHRGAIINHTLGFVALAAAVVGDYHLAHAYDRHADHVVYGVPRPYRRVSSHRHHDGCGHHRSSWQAPGHNAYGHHGKHARGHAKGHKRDKRHRRGHH